MTRSFRGEPGRFYSDGTSLALGKGCICAGCVMAIFDPERGLYRTGSGVAYVLTHECDVEQANDRPYNDDLLLCPLLPLEGVVDEMSAEHDDAGLTAFLGNLGARNVSRLTYLPPIAGAFPYGAVMFLNAVTAFGLREIEYALENHLLRPKADRVAFDQG